MSGFWACTTSIFNTVSNSNIQQAVTILRQGGLVAFPTETVYGLGADATNPTAIARIFAAKGRPVDHPVIVHIGSVEQLKDWAREVNPIAQQLAQHFWPGPLTLILPRAPQVSLLLTGGQETIGIRIPRHPIAQELLQAFGKGVAAPSANRFGHVSPTLASHVQQELGDTVDYIIDGGACELGIESTIVDCTSARPRILRPGSITASQINVVIELASITDTAMPRVSGALESHYAPQTPLQIVDAAELNTVVAKLLPQGKKIAVLARQPAFVVEPNLVWIMMSADPNRYSHDLYAQLRAVDALQCGVIIVEAVSMQENWYAINDRLQKAATKRK